MTRAGVFGIGTWGTAFALVLADAGTDVVIWGRRPELCEAVNRTRRNPDYLPDIELPDGVRATTDPQEAAAGADLIALAVPSQTLRGNLSTWVPVLPPNAVLVSLMKGIELGTAKRMSEVIEEVADIPADRVAVVSGPNLAGEIALRQPAASVVASVDEARAQQVQKACHSPYFRPYTNTDVVGTELGGTVKNVIALACGMAAGVGLGENTAAAIITRGLAEIMRLGIALGAKPATMAGLAGVGDLVATCTSPYSRNRSFGERLGKGGTMESALQAAGGHIAEGVTSCESVLALASSYDVEMPLTDAVQRVCHKGLSVDEAVALLLGRSTKPE